MAGRNPHRIWAAVVASTMIVVLSGCGSRSGADAPYVGSEWRLTEVADGSTSVQISAALDATIDLLDDGHILADDSVNTTFGKFTITADGFEVTDTATSLVGYIGDDQQTLAAIKGLQALLDEPSDGRTSGPHPGNTVISADNKHLVVDAHSLRLDFDYAGPARTTKPHR